MDWTARFVEHARQCMTQPLGYPPCNEFWGLLFLVGFVVIGVMVIRMIYRSHSNWREEQRLMEEIIKGRRVVTPNRMDVRPRKGSETTETGLKYDELVGAIKDEPVKR